MAHIHFHTYAASCPALALACPFASGPGFECLAHLQVSRDRASTTIAAVPAVAAAFPATAVFAVGLAIGAAAAIFTMATGKNFGAAQQARGGSTRIELVANTSLAGGATR
jgi:hypothetical protein